jgi:hypothetical protein
MAADPHTGAPPFLIDANRDTDVSHAAVGLPLNVREVKRDEA